MSSIFLAFLTSAIILGLAIWTNASSCNFCQSLILVKITLLYLDDLHADAFFFGVHKLMRLPRQKYLNERIRLTTEKDCKRYGRGACKYYAKLAEQEEGFGKVHPFGKAGRIIRFIAPLNGKIGLDVGCGEGFETRKLSSAGSSMVGCDVDPNLLRIAKKRSRKKPGQSSFIQCDAEHLPLKDAVFDFIVAFDVLEHIPQPESMLQESSRTLKDRGILVLAVPNGWGPNELLWRTARFAARVIGLTFSKSAHVQSFNVFFLKHMIRRNCLKIVKIRPHNFLAAAAFVPIQILCAAVNRMIGMEEEEIRVIVGRLCIKLDRSSVGKLLDWMDRVYFNELFFPFVSGFDFVCLRHKNACELSMASSQRSCYDNHMVVEKKE